jgi:hypothetical protein
MTTALEQLAVPKLCKLKNSICHAGMGKKARINGGEFFGTCPNLTS